MIKRRLCLASLCLLGVAGAASANVGIEPTFQQKMAESDLVVIGTVTAVTPGGRRGRGSTATLAVSHTLKGDREDKITVRTYHPVAELNPRCCVQGATYIMFLRHAASDGKLASGWGSSGMVRIGAPPQSGIRAIPEAELVGDRALPAD